MYKLVDKLKIENVEITMLLRCRGVVTLNGTLHEVHK